MGKPVQIDSDQLALLTAGHKMLEQLYADPEKGMEFKKIIKAKYPTASVPDLEAVSAVEKMFKPLEERLNKFDAERAKEREDGRVAEFQSRFDRVVKDNGYTEDGQKRLLDLMKTRGIQNPEDAAVLFEKDMPKPSKASKPYSSRMNFVTSDGEKDADFNKLMTDPDAFMVDGMMTAIEDMKRERN